MQTGSPTGVLCAARIALAEVSFNEISPLRSSGALHMQTEGDAGNQVWIEGPCMRSR